MLHLLLAISLAATPADAVVSRDEPLAIFHSDEGLSLWGRSLIEDSVIVRGQSPAVQPPVVGQFPANGSGPGMFGQGMFGQQSPSDPFLMQDPVFGAQPGGQQFIGVNGPQPYRFGVTPKFIMGYLPSAGVKAPGAGNFQSIEFDSELKEVMPLASSWIFTHAPQFGSRSWSGPNSPNLPSQVYRAGWLFELATPADVPWNFRLGFNPSINSDFQQSIGGRALNFDGYAAMHLRVDPTLMFVIGATYWDRKDNIILPMAGVVWNPDDIWELRLTFPEGRIRAFLGATFNNEAHWLYVSGRYNVESYEIEGVGGNRHEQIQLADWRLAVGVESEHPLFTKFVEAAYVFGRKVEFKETTPGFQINDGLMIRAGIKF